MERWEWRILDSARVAATIDDGFEHVLVGGQLESKGARGSKPMGHVVELARRAEDGPDDPPRVITVRFDPRSPICILTLDGLEISPDVWPSRKKPVVKPPETPFPLGTVAVLLAIAAAVMAVIFFFRHKDSFPSTGGAMSEIYRAPNGLFVARFPPSFSARVAVAPKPMNGVVVEQKRKNDVVVILATPVQVETQRDVWGLHKRLYGEALANVPRANGDHLETSREEGTCLGQPGALVVARVTNAAGEQAKVSSCAFAFKSAGYVVLTAVRENASADEANELQRVAQGTELTELSDMSEQR